MLSLLVKIALIANMVFFKTLSRSVTSKDSVDSEYGLFLKPCPEVLIHGLSLWVMVRMSKNAKITDPKYLWYYLPLCKLVLALPREVYRMYRQQCSCKR